jgi:hypothetical protein
MSTSNVSAAMSQPNPYQPGLSPPSRGAPRAYDPRRRWLGWLCYGVAFCGAAALPIVSYALIEMVRDRDWTRGAWLMACGLAALMVFTLFFAALGSWLRHGRRRFF